MFRLMNLALLYRRIFEWLGYIWWFWAIVLVAHWPALIDQPSFIFDFQLNLFFHVTLLYSNLFTYLVIKLPLVYYLFSDQVTSRRFHSLTLDGNTNKCVSYVFTMGKYSVSSTIFLWFSYHNPIAFFKQLYNKEVINFINNIDYTS